MANVTITDSSVLPKSITITEDGKTLTISETKQPVDIAVDQLTITESPAALNDISDVNITSLADNQILVYDSATSKWINEANAGGGGGAVNSVNGLTGVVVLDTDDIAEDGSPTNKYFTDARAQTVINSNSAGFITADSTSTLTNKSGAVSQFTNDAGYLTSETDSQTLSLSTPNLSISGGNSVDLTPLTSGFITASSTDSLTNKSGNISMFTNDSGYLKNIVEDTTPELGANLDAVSTYKIVNLVNPTSNQDAATKAYVDSSSATGISAVVDDTTPQLGGNLDVLAQNIFSSTSIVKVNDGLQIMAGNSLRLENTAQTQNVTISGTLTTTGYDLKLPTTAPAASQYITVDAAGQLTFSNVPTVISNNNQLSNGAGYITASSSDALTNKTGNISQWTNDSGYLTSVEADTTPQLGGALDLKGQIIGPDSTRNYQIIGNQASPSSSTYDSFSSGGSRVFGTVVVEEVSNPAVNQRVHSNPKLTLISLDADRNDNNARFRCNYTEAVLQTNAFDVDPGVNFGRGFIGEFLSAKISNAGASAATVGQHSAIIVSPQVDGLTSNVTVQDQRGVEVQPFIASGGTVDNMYGIHYSVNNSGTVTNQYSLYGSEAGATAYNAGGFQLPIVTVSNLSTLPQREGNTAYVNNNTAGTGSVAKCMVFYDGSNWKLAHEPGTTAA